MCRGSYDPAVVKYDVAMKRMRDTLKSSFDHLHREVICEMEKLEDQLKVDLSMMSDEDLLLLCNWNIIAIKYLNLAITVSLFTLENR